MLINMIVEIMMKMKVILDVKNNNNVKIGYKIYLIDQKI